MIAIQHRGTMPGFFRESVEGWKLSRVVSRDIPSRNPRLAILYLHSAAVDVLAEKSRR